MSVGGRRGIAVAIAGLGMVFAGATEAARRDPLTRIERKLVSWVDAHAEEAVDLLERVVAINSGTLNLAGVRAVGDVFRAELDRLGFTTRWEDGAPFERAGHLVAERVAVNAGGAPRLLLIGHLDTVFEPDSPFQRFERIDAKSARGPGIIDMKGGDVILLQSLKALAAHGLLSRMNITVVLSGDEEKPGRPLALARRALVEAGKTADIAIGFEDGDGDPHHAVAARRGASSWELHVTATTAHSSQIFRDDIGAGAIFEAARVLDGFRQRLGGEALLTFNPGVIVGGTRVEFDGTQARGSAAGKNNVIAGQAVVAGDLRALTSEQLERARSAMREVAAAALPHAISTLTFDDGHPPMAGSDGNLRLLAVYDEASRDLGLGEVTAVDPSRAGAADISFVAGQMKMALDGIGLRGRDGHTVEETADLTTLASQTRRAVLLLHRVGGVGRRR